jgi:hypothetical protein
MKKVLKDFFIPHEDNNYHPHLLHTKRAVFYSLSFLFMKAVVVLFVLLLPLDVFVLPDVLAQEQSKILNLVNELRLEKGLSKYTNINKLDRSSYSKADDMSDKEYFSHISPENKNVASFLREVGYDYKVAGENLAMGFTTAEEVVQAWKDSPTHYANIIDGEFNDFGIGIETGKYNKIPTVYVAAHFGLQKNSVVETSAVATPTPEPELPVEEVPEPTPVPTPEPVVSEPEPTPIVETTPVVESAPVEVLEPIVEQPVVVENNNNNIIEVVEKTPVVESNIVYDSSQSFVYWYDKGNKTALSVDASITGDVKSVTVHIKDHSLYLKPDENSGLYRGYVEIDESIEELFNVILTPTIKIVTTDNNMIQDNIQWKEVQVVSPTPIAKYTKAKSSLAGITKIFDVSKNIYMLFLFIFSLALILNIFIEIKTQHHHVIAQTLLLIVLLTSLVMV